MFKESRNADRRQFLRIVTCSGFAGALSLTGQRLLADEPFDSLPPDVLQNARANGLVMIHRPTPAKLAWRAQIAGDDEPGQPLIVAGKVTGPDGRTPAGSVTVYAYNTDARGRYGAGDAEYPPRLYGWMKTDPAGRFELRTILPGSYPGMHVPAHIHFTLWGGGFPLQWVDELRFEGDRHITPEMTAEAGARGEFGAIQPLARGGDGTLHCSFKIRLARKSNFG